MAMETPGHRGPWQTWEVLEMGTTVFTGPVLVKLTVTRMIGLGPALYAVIGG
jgi:hypothetical protein